MNRDIYVGKNADGDTLSVSIALRPLERDMLTVEHDPVNGGTELAITGVMYRRGIVTESGLLSAGQNLDELLLITKPAPGWSLDELRELHDLWQRWHLNGMRAACAHMKLPADTYDARKDITCEKGTGYRYGSAWLYEPLPTSVVERVHVFQRRLKP